MYQLYDNNDSLMDDCVVHFAPQGIPESRIQAAKRRHEEIKNRAKAVTTSAPPIVLDKHDAIISMPTSSPPYFPKIEEHDEENPLIYSKISNPSTVFTERNDDNAENFDLPQLSNQEKDALIINLVKEVNRLQQAISQAADVGEGIATKMLISMTQQKEMFGLEKEELEQRLYNSTYHHPAVLELEKQVIEARKQIRSENDKLKYTLKKLQQSRQRERKLLDAKQD